MKHILIIYENIQGKIIFKKYIKIKLKTKKKKLNCQVNGSVPHINPIAI